jgi:hypothetical protein
MKRVLWTYALALLLSCNPDYQSGSTECSPAGTCPKGFVCGGGSSIGAPNVCYDANLARCASTEIYYCPSSASCWSAQVACSTVRDCGNGNISACPHDGYTSDCVENSQCHPNGGSSGTGTGGSGGSAGGAGGAGGSTDPCAPLSTDTACYTCQDNSCCSQMTACSNQASCHSLLTCMNKCSSGDTTCMNNCESSYSSGVTTLTTFAKCVTTSCSSSCN